MNNIEKNRILMITLLTLYSILNHSVTWWVTNIRVECMDLDVINTLKNHTIKVPTKCTLVKRTKD